MKNRCLILLASVAVLLAGCAPVRTQEATYQQGSHPDIDVRVSATVGQVMVSEYDYLARETATVLQPVKRSFWRGRQELPAGTALVKARAGKLDVYCVAGGGFGSACLHDSNNDKSFDRAYTINAYGAAVNGANIDTIPYRLGDQSIQDGFKYELVYQGIDRDVAKITYREYSDNLARPAYRQDLTYTLEASGDTAVSFRDVRLVIHQADNNEITYTVKSGF